MINKVSGISSGARGLIPKSYAGKKAMVGAGMIAGGAVSYRRSKNQGGRGVMGAGLMAGGAALFLPFK
jgi:hypothetical protein